MLKSRRRGVPRIAFAIVMLLGMLLPTIVARAVPPAEGAFMRTWQRTDALVADGTIARTWMWGPEANSAPMMEPYLESGALGRQVQYFDKSRMEITHPQAPDDGLWYVTNGLLVVEMITGQLQIGDDTFLPLSAAGIPVAGDYEDPLGPTYATFSTLLDEPATPLGNTYRSRLNRDGSTVDDAGLAARGVTAAALDEVTGHAIAAPFQSFIESRGPVLVDGVVTEDLLVIDPLYVTGRPITEAYWAWVRIDGTYRDVLVQCFERRCLTYAPDNEPGWQVEAGNVGLHYQVWRYQSGFSFAIVWVDAEEGGVVEHDGVKLDFPPGALSRDTLVTIVASAPPSAPEGYSGVGQAYALGLSGATLQSPATITLPFDETLLAEGVLPEHVVVGRVDDEGQWTLLDGDAGNGTVSIATQQFSTWQALAPDDAPAVNAPPVGQNQDIPIVPIVETTITLTASDPDSPSLTFQVINEPQQGTLSTLTPDADCTPLGNGVECSATLTYMSDYGASGTDAFQWTASDGTDTSAPATVAIQLQYMQEESAEINAEEGGTFELPGQVRIIFEPGVLDCDAIVTVTGEPGAQNAVDWDSNPLISVGNQYLITLEPANPEDPVCWDFVSTSGYIILGIWYDPSALPDGRTEDEIFLAVKSDYYSTVNVDATEEELWYPVSSWVDTEENIVYTETESLSRWNPFIS